MKKRNRVKIFFLSAIFLPLVSCQKCIVKSTVADGVTIDSTICKEKLVAVSYSYVDSVPDSLYLRYNNSGIVISKNRFFHSRLHGLQEYYFDDGSLRMSNYFIHGQKNVDQIEYFHNQWIREDSLYPNIVEPKHIFLKPSTHSLYLNDNEIFKMRFNKDGEIISITGQPILVFDNADSIYYLEKPNLYYCNLSLTVGSIDNFYGKFEQMNEVDSIFVFDQGRLDKCFILFKLSRGTKVLYRGKTDLSINEEGKLIFKYETY